MIKSEMMMKREGREKNQKAFKVLPQNHSKTHKKVEYERVKEK
jgi:hypothetical protein